MTELILFGVIVVLLALLLAYHIHVRKTLGKIDRSLDAAIAGKLDIAEFSETQASKLDAKLARHLTGAKLRQEDLIDIQEKTRELISDISHQTKTSLSNIVLSAQLLAEQPELSPESRDLVAQLERGAEKLSFLIQSLVKVSRLESGTIQVVPVRQNLCDLVDSCVESCQWDANARKQALTFARPERDVFALCDFKWCGEAVCNIIDNAIKYTPELGKIEISIVDYEMFSCIRISDSGRGIPEEELPKIFGRFYRGAHSAGAPGVGIGLYLAREIVHRCGGYIQATSELGKGSVFSLYLSKL